MRRAGRDCYTIIQYFKMRSRGGTLAAAFLFAVCLAAPVLCGEGGKRFLDLFDGQRTPRNEECPEQTNQDYNQCNPEWADERLGESGTIC